MKFISLLFLILFLFNSCAHKRNLILAGYCFPVYPGHSSISKLLIKASPDTTHAIIMGVITASDHNQKKDSVQGLAFSTVAFFHGGSKPEFASLTDIEGKFRQVVAAGKYDIEFSCVGFKSLRLEGLVVNQGNSILLNIFLQLGSRMDTISAEDYLKKHH